MIHVSEISAEKRIERPQDVLRAGQVVKAKVLDVDNEKRQIRLSMKQLVPTGLDEYIAERKLGEDRHRTPDRYRRRAGNRRTRRRHPRAGAAGSRGRAEGTSPNWHARSFIDSAPCSHPAGRTDLRPLRPSRSRCVRARFADSASRWSIAGLKGSKSNWCKQLRRTSSHGG